MNYAEKKLKNISEETKKESTALIDLLKEKLFPVEEINAAVLFGSFARGDYSVRHSDIDIMIFLDLEKEDEHLEEYVRKKVISLNLGKDVGIHVLFQYKKINEEDRSLMLTISREGKVLFTKKMIFIGTEILGLKPYLLIKFETADTDPLIKNKLQRFLHGYTINGKYYEGIINNENVLQAGKGAIIAVENISDKIFLFAKKIGIKAVQKAKFYA